MDYTKKF